MYLINKRAFFFHSRKLFLLVVLLFLLVVCIKLITLYVTKLIDKRFCSFFHPKTLIEQKKK